MSPTPRVRELRDRVEELRRLLLPSPFDPTGAYSEPLKTHLLTLAFRLMAHAEVETFLEERAVEIALTAWRDWKQNNLSSRPLVAMLAFSGIAQCLPPDSITENNAGKQQAADVDFHLQKSLNVYMDAIRKNHGVKEENLVRLLIPIGLKSADLDPALIADLDSFGGDRGEAAHTSGTKVSRYCDPMTEYLRVERIITLLETLDDLLLTLI